MNIVRKRGTSFEKKIIKKQECYSQIITIFAIPLLAVGVTDTEKGVFH